ncbi:MAG TPA: Bcr/CflA family multidrug efflux MFS transporter [Paenalcaligenes sp.]|nr:Bcr/CflA family multidrug efflux MFS transporter [Paenalcaligenes sp.]
MSNQSPDAFGRTFPGWLVLMAFLTAIGPIAIDMYLPAFPAMASSLDTTPGHIERTLAGYLFGLSIAQLFYGPLSDRFGRRIPLFAGLFIFLVASIGCALSTDIDHLYFWRIAQAFGGAASMVIPRAVIRDRLDTNDAAKALSILMLIMGVTPILAPIIGGQFLIFLDWHSIFLFMVAYAGIMLFLGWRHMDETLPEHRKQELRPSVIFKNYGLLLSHRGFMLYALAGAFGSAGMFAYISGSPRVFIQTFGVDPSIFGFIFGLNAASFILMAQVNARLLNKFRPSQLLLTAQLVQALTAIGALILSLLGWLNLPLTMLCLVLFMGALGMINPNSAALALSRHARRLGSASALMGTLQMLGGALAGLAISIWSVNSTLPLVTILFTCALLSWLCGRLANL